MGGHDWVAVGRVLLCCRVAEGGEVLCAGGGGAGPFGLIRGAACYTPTGAKAGQRGGDTYNVRMRARQLLSGCHTTPATPPLPRQTQRCPAHPAKQEHTPLDSRQ